MAVVAEEDCSLVIPAYNEESRIGDLMDSLISFRGELVFVCDGSDRTARIIDDFSSRNSGLHIRCLEFSQRLGKGGGVLAGIKASSKDYVGFMDADGSTSLSEMRRLFLALSRYDGAIGSRWLPDSVVPVSQGMWRRFQSRVFNFAVRMLFGLHFSDTQCGAKAFRAHVLTAVLPLMHLSGFEFDVELLWRLERSGCTIVELPITWTNREGSTVHGSTGLGMLISLLSLRLSG